MLEKTRHPHTMFVEEMSGFDVAINDLRNRYDCDVVEGTVKDLVGGKITDTEIIGLIKGPRTKLTSEILAKLVGVMKDPVIAYIGRHPEKILDTNLPYKKKSFEGRSIIILPIDQKEVVLLPMEQSPLSDAVAAYVTGMTKAVILQEEDILHNLTMRGGNTFEKRVGHSFSLASEANNTFSGCTAGVIGAGDIGSRVIDEFSQGGAHVYYYGKAEASPIQTNGLIKKVRTINNILQKPLHVHEPYVVTLHVPRGVTIPLADVQGIDLFINTSSGTNIQKDELMRALDEGRIARAIIDTFTKEGDEFSQDSFSQLISDDRLILTPHIAYNNPVMIQKALQTTMDTLLQYRESLAKTLRS